MLCPTCASHPSPTKTQNELRIMVKLKEWLDSEPFLAERFKNLAKLDEFVEKESS